MSEGCSGGGEGQVSLQVLMLITAASSLPCLCDTFFWAAVAMTAAATTAAAVKAQGCKAPICPLLLLQRVHKKGACLPPPYYGSVYINSLMCA